MVILSLSVCRPAAAMKRPPQLTMAIAATAVLLAQSTATQVDDWGSLNATSAKCARSLDYSIKVLAYNRPDALHALLTSLRTAHALSPEHRANLEVIVDAPRSRSVWIDGASSVQSVVCSERSFHGQCSMTLLAV